MPSKDTLLCLNYNGDVRAFAKLSETSRRVILALLLTGQGFHLSLHRGSQSGKTHVEYSSCHPVGSVWDGARIGIAEQLRYKQPQKHACYVLNAPLYATNKLNVPILSHRLTFDSFSRSMPTRHARLPRICVPAIANPFLLSFHFSPDNSTVPPPDSTILPTALGTLTLHIQAG